MTSDGDASCEFSRIAHQALDLDQATKVDTVEIRWLSGQVDTLHNLDVNLSYKIQEGGTILKAAPWKPVRPKST